MQLYTFFISSKQNYTKKIRKIVKYCIFMIVDINNEISTLLSKQEQKLYNLITMSEVDSKLISYNKANYADNTRTRDIKKKRIISLYFPKAHIINYVSTRTRSSLRMSFKLHTRFYTQRQRERVHKRKKKIFDLSRGYLSCCRDEINIGPVPPHTRWTNEQMFFI